MPTFTDKSGQKVTLPADPRRIVSLVPSMTETLFALGLGERVKAVTRYCVKPRPMPAHVRRVGGTKNPDFEAIAALVPDLILVNTEENRTEDIVRLREIAPTFEDFPRTAEEGAKMVRTLGELTGTVRRAEEIAATIEAEIAAVRHAAKGLGGRRRRAAYLIWKDPWMSINADTFIDDVLRLSGMENVYADRTERYPETTIEEMAERAPEVVLLPSEPYPFKLQHRNEFLEYERIPAARLGRVYVVDGTFFCWHGYRQIEGLRWIRGWLMG